MSIDIERVRSDDPVAVTLVADLLVDLDQRYGPEEDGGAGWLAEVTPEKAAPPDGAFLVARLEGGEVVGCGAIKRYDAATAEVKRMYTAPAGRRRGVARALLAQLEDEARALGYTMIRLETGTEQPEAMRLYESRGYTLISNYGRYAEDPRSRCYEREL